jgi:hypothetical protein
MPVRFNIATSSRAPGSICGLPNGWLIAQLTPGMVVRVERDYLEEPVEYRRTGYDWREHEARLNAVAQFTTGIDGQYVHFLHVRSPEVDVLPLIITHDWPSTVCDFVEILGPRSARLEPGMLRGLDPTQSDEIPIARDTILTDVTIYWLTSTAGSAARLYREAGAQAWGSRPEPSPVPTGVANFLGDRAIRGGAVEHDHTLVAVPHRWPRRLATG